MAWIIHQSFFIAPICEINQNLKNNNLLHLNNQKKTHKPCVYSDTTLYKESELYIADMMTLTACSSF